MSHRARVRTALDTVYVIWGSTYLGIYYAGRTIPPPCRRDAVVDGNVSRIPDHAPRRPLAATSLEMLAGGFVMLPNSAFTVHHFSPSPSSVAGWIYLVAGGPIVGYTAYVWLLANAPVGLVSTYAFVNPIVAITLGVIFLDEHLTWRLLAGALIVVIAVAAVVSREPAAAPQPE